MGAIPTSSTLSTLLIISWLDVPTMIHLMQVRWHSCFLCETDSCTRVLVGAQHTIMSQYFLVISVRPPKPVMQYWNSISTQCVASMEGYCANGFTLQGVHHSPSVIGSRTTLKNYFSYLQEFTRDKTCRKWSSNVPILNVMWKLRIITHEFDKSASSPRIYQHLITTSP